MTLWFLARAAGFVALLASSITIALGAAGIASRGDNRIVVQLVHRTASVVALAMLGLHGVLLVTDHFVDVSPAGALVPFTAGYRSLALGLGTLALYGFLAAAASGALRRRMALSASATRAWRAVHVSAYAAWLLSMGHGLLAGSDTGATWASLVYAVCAFVVAVAVAGRVASGIQTQTAALPSARRARHRERAATAGEHR